MCDSFQLGSFGFFKVSEKAGPKEAILSQGSSEELGVQNAQKMTAPN